MILRNLWECLKKNKSILNFYKKQEYKLSFIPIIIRGGIRRGIFRNIFDIWQSSNMLPIFLFRSVIIQGGRKYE